MPDEIEDEAENMDEINLATAVKSLIGAVDAYRFLKWNGNQAEMSELIDHNLLGALRAVIDVLAKPTSEDVEIVTLRYEALGVLDDHLLGKDDGS